MKIALGGSRSDVVRIGWIAGVVVLWPLWYLLYALAFAWLNEMLTRIGPLSTTNGMLAPAVEFIVQVLLAAAFGFVGMTLIRRARAPKVVWYVGAGMSLVLALATVALWSASAAGSGSGSTLKSFVIYAVVGASMALGCWVGSSVVKPTGRARP